MLILPERAENTIVGMFMVHGRIIRAIEALYKAFQDNGLPNELKARRENIEDASAELCSKSMTLRSVFEDVFWAGFVCALDKAERHDLLVSYPSVTLVVEQAKLSQ